MTYSQIHTQFEDQKIYSKMSIEEQDYLCYISIAGYHQRNEDGTVTIFLGPIAFNRIKDYELDMLAKYGCVSLVNYDLPTIDIIGEIKCTGKGIIQSIRDNTDE
jgi:hypothetical protein